jgi:hypothetical protein
LFCSESRQLSKYRTVSSYRWLFPSSNLSLDFRLPCVKRLIVNHASWDEIQCAATPVPGSWVERFDKSNRGIDVNS